MNTTDMLMRILVLSNLLTLQYNNATNEIMTNNDIIGGLVTVRDLQIMLT